MLELVGGATPVARVNSARVLGPRRRSSSKNLRMLILFRVAGSEDTRATPVELVVWCGRSIFMPRSFDRCECSSWPRGEPVGSSSIAKDFVRLERGAVQRCVNGLGAV